MNLWLELMGGGRKYETGILIEETNGPREDQQYLLTPNRATNTGSVTIPKAKN